MAYLNEVMTVAALYALAMISPGPNFLVITRTSIAESRQNGLFTGIGVAAGSTIWATIGSFGLGFFMLQVSWLAGALKCAGGLYLIYLALRIYRGARKPLAEIEATEVGTKSGWSSFRLGLLTNLTNPKSAAFFASLFAGAVSPTTPAWVYIELIAAIAALSLSWHITLALVFSSRGFQQAYRRIKVGVDMICSALLLIAGSRLVLTVFT